jgi:uncharacterized repeat protein (TIGR01451 family)/LPXTG-motif cell wall-anchored protein
VANVPVVNAIAAAYGNLAGEAQTGAIDLAASPTVTPGVYDVAATAFNSTLTLNGAGVYIFRSTSSIAQTAGGTMALTGGATACNVYWQIPTSMTFAAAPASIVGTIITNTGMISFVSGVALEGRAWAKTQVTMDNNQITQPTCVAATPTGNTGTLTGTINVVKNVINDNGSSKVSADFPLFVNSIPVASGQTNTFTANSNMYTVTESNSAGYTSSFSGDCDANGVMYLHAAEHLFCIMTNNDIGAPVIAPPVPPLIDIVKVPSPLSLPTGPGVVLYTYTTRNIGTVPMTNVTLVGDTCSPIVLQSGDTDNDAQLDVTETWVYTCSTTLTATHTNTVVATGWANGLSAVDIASATVVVGQPVVPPLIHITKTPNLLTLPVGGGNVTYTKHVTNPGTVALSNVIVTDDKCSPVQFISGDTDGDSQLDVSENWTYTCTSNLTATTTNTATATGTANGYTVRDIAIATVVVAASVPALPNTGFTPIENNLVWAGLATILSGASLFFVLKTKRA